MIYQGVINRSSINKQRIIRTLLNNPTGNLTKYQVAKESWCKFPTAHEILKKLQNKDLIIGTKVIDYEALVKEWIQSQIKPNRYGYLIKNPIKLLKKVKLNYVLTTYIAENTVQRYLIPSVTEFYINSVEKTIWHNIIIEEGGLIGRGNITILSGDEHVFYKSFEKDSLNYVSIPQLIIDLTNEGGVCIDAADKLIKREKDALSKL